MNKDISQMESANILEHLIDSRNQELWAEIENNFNITLKPNTVAEYSCYTQNDDVVFYVNEADICKDSFTHEMLHVYIRLRRCFIGAGLKNTINRSRILTSLFSSDLLEHVGNCLDHVKMLPIYLDMGFERKKFILDYEHHKCSAVELNNLKRNYKVGKKINSQAADLLIGKVFAIKADPNIDFDYSDQITQLKKIDPLLFTACERLIENWIMVDIKGNEIDYHSILNDYYEDLKKWFSNNTFI